MVLIANIKNGGITMANSNDAKRAAFMQRIKVNQSSQQQAAAKRAQVSSNNASNSGNNNKIIRLFLFLMCFDF